MIRSSVLATVRGLTKSSSFTSQPLVINLSRALVTASHLQTSALNQLHTGIYSTLIGQYKTKLTFDWLILQILNQLHTDGATVNSSIEEFMRKHEISVKSGNYSPLIVCHKTILISDWLTDTAAPSPVLTFGESGLPDYLLEKLSQTFTAPTPIQAQALPIALSGKNMVSVLATKMWLNFCENS